MEMFEEIYSVSHYNIQHVNIVGKAITWNHQGNTDPVNGETAFLAATFDNGELIFEPRQTLSYVIDNFKNTENRKYLCAIVSLKRTNWVAILLLKLVNKIRMIYFDPCGNQALEELVSILKEQIGREHFLDLTTHLEDPDVPVALEKTESGPTCLRFFELMLLKISQNEDICTSLYSKALYHVLMEMHMLPRQRKEEFVRIKYCFHQQCQLHQAMDTLTTVSSEHSSFQDFKQELTELLKKLQHYQKDFNNYRDCLKEVSEGQEGINILEELKVAKEKIEENPLAQKFLQEGEGLVRNWPANFQLKEDYFHGLAAKYQLPEKITQVFRTLWACWNSKNVVSMRTKNQFSSVLGLSLPELNQLLCNQDEPNLEQMQTEIFADIDAFLESFNKETSPLQRDELMASELNKEQGFTEFMDALILENKSLDFDPQIAEQLTEAYENFIEYRKKWRTASATEIFHWAGNAKAKSSEMKTPEIIAVIDRAYEILRNGKKLSHQILTLLFLQLEGIKSSHAKICETQYKERSTTIAVLAILRILLGDSSVDIITFNSPLTEERLRDTADLYKLFQIQVAPNSATIEDNDFPRSFNRKNCYSAKVIYGTMENFQKDYLQHFYGARRDFGFLILDEIDNMLMEDSSCASVLFHTFPAFESLQEIYLEIWISLLSMENSYPKELRDLLLDRATALNDQQDTIRLPSRISLYKEYREELKTLIYSTVHIKIKESLVNIQFPNHMTEFIFSSLDKWIDSAILAMYKLQENVDYYLSRGEDGQMFVEPMYNNNESIALTNGMYQFLQLKHNLPLTSESLPTESISIYGYINSYGSNILGLTCNFCTEVERKLVKKLYDNIQLLRIPTKQKEKYPESVPCVISDVNWSKMVAVDSYMKSIQEGKAVVIICKTVEDCQVIEKCIETLQDITIKPVGSTCKNILVIYETTNSVKSPLVLYPRDIVITTSCSAKGIGLRLSKELELEDDDQQIHICVGFYTTVREEKRIINRWTEIRGGTLTRIVRFSEVQALQPPDRGVITPSNEDENSDVDLSEYFDSLQQDYHEYVDNDGLADYDSSSNQVAPEVDTKAVKPLTLKEQVLQILDFWNVESFEELSASDFEAINARILENEQERMDKFMEETITTVYFQDQLFSQFWNLSHDLQYSNISRSSFQFWLKDFQEYWSIWISSKDLEEIIYRSVQSDLEGEKKKWEILKKELYTKSKDLFNELEQLPLVQQIKSLNKLQGSESSVKSQNPCYGIYSADFYLRLDQPDLAMKYIDHVLKTEGLNHEILYCAYMIKFKIFIQQNGKSFTKSEGKILKALIKNHLDLDLSHKDEVKQSLLNAQKHMQLHIKHLKDYISDEKDSALKVITENLKQNALFIKTQTPELNISEVLSSHLRSLELNSSAIKNLLQTIEDATSESPSLNSSDLMEESFKIVAKDELQATLDSLGRKLLQHFGTAEIQNPTPALNKIAAGLVAFLEKSTIPLQSSICTSIGGNSVFEGIVELVQAELQDSERSCSGKDFSTINYAINLLLSLDIETNAPSATNLLLSASQACQNVMADLKLSAAWESVGSLQLLADGFDQLSNFLSRVAVAAEYKKLDGYFSSLPTSHVTTVKIPLNVSLVSAHGRDKISQQIVEARIMERQESIYVNAVLSDAKDFVSLIVKKRLDEFWEQNLNPEAFLPNSQGPSTSSASKEQAEWNAFDTIARKNYIKYLDTPTKIEYLKLCKSIFDNSLNNSWTLFTEQMLVEIKDEFRDLEDSSNNFFGGYQGLVFEKIQNIWKIDYLLMANVNNVPDAVEVPNPNELIIMKAKVVVDELIKLLFHWNKGGRDKNGRLSAVKNKSSHSTTNAKEFGHAKLARELRQELGVKYNLEGDENLLEKIRLAYMMLTKVQLYGFYLLEILRDPVLSPMEYLCRTYKDLSPTLKAAANGLDMETNESTLRNRLTRILDETLRKNIQWHRQLQHTYSDCLRGVPSFEVADLQEESNQLGKTGSSGYRQLQHTYSDCLGGVPSFELADLQEESNQLGKTESSGYRLDIFSYQSGVSKPEEKCTCGAERAIQSLCSGQMISPFGSPESGLKFLRETQATVKLPTFSDVPSQIKVLNFCLKKLEDVLAQLTWAPNTIYEIHVDITKIEFEDVSLQMSEVSISSGDHSIEKSVTKFLTIVLGYRQLQTFHSTKKLYKVHTIFPRPQLPIDLKIGQPYYIIARKVPQ